MPKSRKRAKAVVKQRRENRENRTSRHPSQPALAGMGADPGLALQAPDLQVLLHNRDGWDLEQLGMDVWSFLPSTPQGYKQHGEGGPTTVIQNLDGTLELSAPAVEDDAVAPVIYASVEDFAADLDAIELWRHPADELPADAKHFVGAARLSQGPTSS